ncbi:hypothetical protein KR084_009212 [Drosophila pseudotakahashii]|nr:hypothetical protein KR084_009212 [Drosophila pseudotakahashii]
MSAYCKRSALFTLGISLDNISYSTTLEFLDLGGQLRLWEATDPKSRLNKVLLKCWESCNNHSLHGKLFEDKKEVLQHFLQCISHTVGKLTLVDFSIDQGLAFRSYSFPNVRELEYSLEESDTDDIETLVICFPLLKSFKLSVKDDDPTFELFSGQHMARWEHLRKLDIVAAFEHLKTKCFQEICHKLQLKFLSVTWRDSEEDAYVEAISKLQELEELHLELMLLSRENTMKLLALPKLKKLRLDEFEDVEDFLDNVVKMRGQDVVAYTCNENFWLWLTPNRFQNVRKVCILNEGVVDGIWSLQSFNDNLKEFPRLTELYMEDITIWQTGDEFWEMITSCPQLQLLYLQNHEIEEGFLEFSAAIMDKALCQRQYPLVIHFLKTTQEDLVNIILQMLVKDSNDFFLKIFKRLSHSKLEISFKVIKDAYPILVGGLLELELTPLKS